MEGHAGLTAVMQRVAGGHVVAAGQRLAIQFPVGQAGQIGHHHQMGRDHLIHQPGPQQHAPRD